MKNLKDILESIFDVDDNIDTAGDVSIIKKFIEDNYHCSREITISDLPDKNGKYEVSCSFVSVINKKLTSLTNGLFIWDVVWGGFSCNGCELLKSLEGAPKEIHGICGFNCSGCNSLTSLKGAPEKVDRTFDCSNCNSLKSLEGAPKKVGRTFDCNNCTSLKSLKGAPERVGGGFYCNNCSSLKSLEGAPERVNRTFDCSNCTSLKSLKGAPKKVGSNFFCSGCGEKFTYEDIENVSNVKGYTKR